MPAFEQESQAKQQANKWLRNVSQEAKSWVILTILIGLISGVLLIFQMYFLSHIAYAAYIKKSTRVSLVNNFIYLFILIVVRSGLLGIKEVVSFQAAVKVKNSLRNKLLHHFNELGPINLSKIPNGYLVSSVMEQIEGLQDFLVYYLPQLSIAVLMPLAILCFVFPISMTSGLILLVCAPLIPFFMALVGMGASSLQQKNFQALSQMSAKFLDTIQGLTTLKLLGKSKTQANSIFQASDNYRVKIMSVLKVAFLSSAVLEIFSAGSIALLAIYLGMGFINTGTHNLWWSFHHLTLQGALFILLLAPEFFLPLRELATHYHSKAKAIGAAIEINKVFALQADSTKKPVETRESIAMDISKIAIQFQSVTVNYSKKGQSILAAINFTIQAGEKVALVGPSGAGKTTILNTLLKFVIPSSGEILINGKNLFSLTEENWYSLVSWLGQQPTFFHGSVRENLLLAKQEATETQLRKALQFSQLEEVIDKLPQGLDTLIGEQNSGLSGGQAQRLALARIYLKDAPLLLLDEPTASLDIAREQAVFKALNSFWQGKTVLLSTHRLDILENMDRILVISDGKLVQQGGYAELFANKQGLFYQLQQTVGELW